MKIEIICADYMDKVYRIHKTFGFLLEYNTYKKVRANIPVKIESEYNQIVNPYLLNPSTEIPNKTIIPTTPYYANFLAKLFTFLSLKSFLFVRILSHFRFPIFNTTEEAIIYYRKLYPKEQQNLCLPRSLFTACTSKMFKKNGRLFIGVFLPSRAMHAWIIEDGKQPDPYDDIWICYQAVAVMYNK